MTSLPSQFGPFKINYNTQKYKWKMSELIAMCVQEKERLKVEKPSMAHLTIGPNKKNPSRKVKVRKRSKVMMYLTMGKRMKIRYNVIFSIRNVTKEDIVLALRLGWKKKEGKTQCLVSYESYLVDIRPISWWIDIDASIRITNSL